MIFFYIINVKDHKLRYFMDLKEQECMKDEWKYTGDYGKPEMEPLVSSKQILPYKNVCNIVSYFDFLGFSKSRLSHMYIIYIYN